MFKGLGGYPKRAMIGSAVATPNGPGEPGLTVDVEWVGTSQGASGTRGLRMNTSGPGLPLGTILCRGDVAKWDALALDYLLDDLVVAFDYSNPGLAGDILRFSRWTDDGTPSDGTSAGAKAVFGRSVGSPRNEPADFTILASHKFGLLVRNYDPTATNGAGGIWVQVYGNNRPGILLSQNNGTHRATRVDFGDGVSYRLIGDIDGTNSQTFTLQNIVNGSRIFHVAGDALSVGAQASASVVPLSVLGKSDQTADAQQWYKGATLVAKMRHDGLFGAAFLTNSADSGPYLQMGATAIDAHERGAGSYVIRFMSGGAAIMGWRADGYLQWIASSREATTVGAAGGASALPATPTKYLMIKDSAGTTLKIPAYAS